MYPWYQIIMGGILQTHTYAHTHTHSHRRIYTHMNVHTNAHTDAHTHMNTCPCTHIPHIHKYNRHTYIHTQKLVKINIESQQWQRVTPSIVF